MNKTESRPPETQGHLPTDIPHITVTTCVVTPTSPRLPSILPAVTRESSPLSGLSFCIYTMGGLDEG